MIFTEKKQDVTNLPIEYVIAHCISVDCAMGDGVVVPIKKKFPHLKDNCIEYAMKAKNTLGTAYRYVDENGTCYNLYSKQSVYHNAYNITEPVYLDNLKLCLNSLKEQMISHKEKFLGIPKIGCGLDGCNWENVKNLILNVFEDTDIEIFVCLWE